MNLVFADGSSGLPYSLDLAALNLSPAAPGSAVAMRDPAGAITVQIRDAAGRPVLSADGAGVWQRTIYDIEADGLVWTRIEDPLRNAQNADSYRVLQGSDGAGRVRENRDAAGHPTYNIIAAFEQRTINALGHSTTQTLDAAGRVIRVIDPVNAEQAFAYNAADQQLTRTDALGNMTTMVYDIRGQRVTDIDRLGKATTFTYDALGNLLV